MNNAAAFLTDGYDLLGAFKAMLEKMKSYLIPFPLQI